MDSQDIKLVILTLHASIISSKNPTKMPLYRQEYLQNGGNNIGLASTIWKCEDDKNKARLINIYGDPETLFVNGCKKVLQWKKVDDAMSVMCREFIATTAMPDVIKRLHQAMGELDIDIETSEERMEISDGHSL